MNKEYKKVYDLVNSLNFSCDYIKFKNGYYGLSLFSKEYNLFDGVRFNLTFTDLSELKTEIINLIKEYYKDKTLEDENGNIYTPNIEDNKLILFNGVNELNLNEVKGIKIK